LAYYNLHHPYYGAQWPNAVPYGSYYPAYPAYGGPCICGRFDGTGGGWQDDRQRPDLRDYGGNPHVINIERAAEWNTDFRRAIWTGRHLQVVLMSIEPGSDIGLEVHPNVDQFIRIEEGYGLVRMGPRRDNLNFVRRVSEDDAIMIPAGTWHNVTNTGPRPLKLYTIYGPPNHPFGTVHRTKAEAEAAEQAQP
jgi:mannose-6-phosphate isomerase-like protein (cupin superfamily)